MFASAKVDRDKTLSKEAIKPVRKLLKQKNLLNQMKLLNILT